MKNIIIIALFLFASVSSAVPTPPRTEFHWTAPTENTDGSSLTDLDGSKIYCGTQSGSYGSSPIKDIVDPTQTRESFISAGLTDGAWFCAMTAYNTAGHESDYSNELAFILVGGVVLVIVPVEPGAFGIR